MLLALGFCTKDAKTAIDWMQWVSELGGCPQHECLLVADAGVQWNTCLQILTLANQTFRKASIITTDKPYDGWPLACNKMFFTAAKWAQENKTDPWLWMEPDAIPLKRGWLDSIQTEYNRRGAPFMGAIVDGRMFGSDVKYMNGVSVYSDDAYTLLKPFEDSALAFDVAAAPTLLAHGVNSELFHCHWGGKERAPSFVGARNISDPDHLVELRFISDKAVIFHRNKDGTLIHLLREKFFPQIVVMLPFCWKDANLMYQNLQHMQRLHGLKKAIAILHYDSTAPAHAIGPIMVQSKAVFTEVYQSRYPEPKVVGWPWAPNVAFAYAARYMASHLRKPWLWLEADAVPTKKDWLERIAADYASCGKEFMGCHIEGIIPHTGHYNGVMVYPPDTATILRKGMQATNFAFDTEMAGEIHGRAHNSRLIQHNRAQPSFNSIGDIQAHIWPETVLYHPVKDSSLFRFL